MAYLKLTFYILTLVLWLLIAFIATLSLIGIVLILLEEFNEIPGKILQKIDKL